MRDAGAMGFISTVGETDTLIGRITALCRRHFGYLMLFSATINLLYIAPSIFMIQVYDRVLPTGGLLTLAFLCVILLVAMSTLSFVDIMRIRLLSAASRRVDRSLSPALLSAALTDPALPANMRGQLLRDFDSLRAALTSTPAIALADAPWTLLYITVCFLIHPAIGALASFGCIAMTLLAALNNMAVGPHVKRQEEAQQAHYALQASDTTHAHVIRALGMIGTMAQRAQVDRIRLRDMSERTIRHSSLYSSLGRLLRFILQSGTLAVGALLAVDRQISPGAMIAASILVSRAFSPIEQMIAVWQPVRNAIEAYRKLNTLFARQKLVQSGQRNAPPRGKISLDRITLRAPERNRVLLQGVSLEISPGEMIAIVGPSGAGKSLLLKSLIGQILPDDGDVRIDGIPIAQWNADALGRAIGYVPQEIGLLAGSLGDNISRFDTIMGDPTGTIQFRIEAAAQACGIHVAIRSLPNGYDTRIGPSGNGLSIGQAQRVAIARALYGEPSMIVMDEPNAHLDADGEKALFSALANAQRNGAAIIVVAHRPSLLEAADKIAVMQGGRIIDMGPRDVILPRLMGVGNKAMARP